MNGNKLNGKNCSETVIDNNGTVLYRVDKDGIIYDISEILKNKSFHEKLKEKIAARENVAQNIISEKEAA